MAFFYSHLMLLNIHSDDDCGFTDPIPPPDWIFDAWNRLLQG